MNRTYLFDWGDTLMVDFPDQKGKMYLWEKVEAVEGARVLLRELSQKHDIYVATNAADSDVEEIRMAFQRTGLSDYISGYFCRANIGLEKGSPEFFRRILKQLGLKPSQVVMVGDTLEKDILPAMEAGLDAIWLNQNKPVQRGEIAIKTIGSLSEIIRG